MKKIFIFILFFLPVPLVLGVFVAGLQSGAETLPAPPVLGVNEDLLQARVKEVSKTLRCAVCQSESVWESNAGLALQMREIIRERLIQGQSPDEIRAYFVSRYGDFILLKPRWGLGLNWLLWGGPFLLLLIGGASLYRTLRGWVTQTTSTGTEVLPPLDKRDRERIERELRSLE